MEGGGSGDGSLTNVLASPNRDFVISPSGDKVSVKELEGKTIGLYFAANWYSKCETFNPVLAQVYAQLKEQGLKFEVVFVSSDEDQSLFEQFHSKMPWLAVPFNDLQAKRGLTERYHIEGIPSLIILNPNGELLRTDGVDLIYRYGCQAYPFTPERMIELEAEEKSRHASQTLEKLLAINGRDYVLSHKEQVLVSNLVGKTVGLYFSANCSPCAKFTSRLVSIYDSLKEKNKEFEIVFVSMDKDLDEFLQCFNGMPWLALPYDNESSKDLSRYFDIKGIPSLIIVGPDGKTVTRDGRNLINLHMEMAFPFTEAQLQLLQERIDEEAKAYPTTFHHVGHQHVLNLVSANSGGGPYICCECDEQGSGWAYQCIDCGYEVHLKCVNEVGKETEKNNQEFDGHDGSISATNAAES
ncbi:Protein-disulfide reductase protein [Dioscorea alata]|uniref:Protein-disulfide reductase protein n=1 Tax=Dioscorea alata TaxID=55571 RepID=A0ACB7VNE9_DIOAL|nr:Protein-disulfide reductase protein [Dioscorea alata]